MANKNGNSSGIGTATHTVKVYKKSSGRPAGHRSKYDCPCYDRPTKWCTKLMRECVGYSNAICPRHDRPIKGKSKVAPLPVPEVGNRVVHLQNGLGTVVEKQKGENGPLFVVEFVKSGTKARYSLQDTQKMLRPEIKKKTK